MTKTQSFNFQIKIQFDLTKRQVAIRLQYLQFGKHKLIADTIIDICNYGSYAISWSNIYLILPDADCTNLKWNHEDQ